MNKRLQIKLSDALYIYRLMYRIRRFEETCTSLYLHGKLPGMSPHLYIGEEAIAASICLFLDEDDYIVSNHRGYGHCLAKGARMDKMLAEIAGKETGYCKGRGGSMHIADLGIGILGANGIVGAGIPIAVGAAFSIAYKNTDQIAVCFFGDAASNQGAFHESINMAACMKLPILFVCENNQYGLSTPIAATCPTIQVSDKAHGYGIKHATVDGMDPEKTYWAAKKAINYVRSNRHPYFLECITYRFLGHGASDNRSYRSREEEETWKKRCPIKTLKNRLTDFYQYPEKDIITFENEVEKELEEALKFAFSSPEPSPENALDYIFK